MQTKSLKFAKPTEVTNPGDDSRSFLFPFSMIAADLVGAPEEVQATTEHRLIVTVTKSLLPAWRLTEPELVKVLFEIGRRAIAVKVKAGTLKREHREIVTTESHSLTCPYDPSLIQEPAETVFVIDEERRIGF